MSNFKPLSTIADVISGYAFSSTWFGSGKQKVIRISDIVGQQISLLDAVTFDAEKHWVPDKFKVKAGDILIALSGATTGKIGIVCKDVEGAYVNQRVAIVRGFTLANRQYLTYILQSVYVEKTLASAGGAAQPNLSPKLIEDLIIPIPDDTVQMEIGERLQIQFSLVSRAKKAIEFQRREVDNLANAIIYDSLNSSDLTNHNLGEVLDEVKNGIGITWKDFPVYGATRKGIALAKEPPGKNPQRYKPIVPGTVFYNPMRILIGSIAFAEDDVEDGITSPDYVVLKGKEGLVNSRWFYYWLRSPLGQDCINSLARGAVRERMLFNRLAEGNIDLPDYNIQEKAADALQNLKKVSANLNKQFQEIAGLPKRLLSNIFQEV